MIPSRYQIGRRVEETADTVTFALTPLDRPLPEAQPGQFHMLYAFGVGEVPISVSGRLSRTVHQHTLRAVGAVTKALFDATAGTILGVRGPFGRGWAPPAQGSDVVIVAGGIGLAPLRPVIQHAVANRGLYGRVTVVIGARSPADLLYVREYPRWEAGGIEVRSTVDAAGPGWQGNVGVVTTLLPGLVDEPAATAAMLCGPEVMMRFAARALMDQGVPPGAVQVSLERNMRCGIGECGHCQLGPLLLCRDGPVTGYDVAQPLVSVKEL
ncbi:MAG TPA: FAD/NAD(P)-binding protein [Candidatus Limnocylindrales bacterium]|nr:FAD/NAD(P)-binding protein [Candidatus Limnocylindrales bacterium]